jgi:hypothetical protein
MKRNLGWMAALAALVLSTVAGAETKIVRIADSHLQLGLDAADGTPREMIDLPAGENQLVAQERTTVGLWRFVVQNGDRLQAFTAEQSGRPQIEPLAGQPAGLRLVWPNVTKDAQQPIRVEVVVHVGQQNTSLSRWELTVTKPAAMPIKRIQFPRVPGLKPRPDEQLAVPGALGELIAEPRKLLAGRDGKGGYRGWGYPAGLSAQCLTLYQPDGLGFYAACDDTLAYVKTFALWRDRQQQLHFEMVHEPEQEAIGVAEFHLPFAVVVGTFRGDWSTAAALYRESPAARVWAGRGRLSRQQTPGWVQETALWVWNRGRVAGVLPPAADMAQHLKLPVSVFWHWWHNCPYDAGFPEYLPPRDGVATFTAALAKAHQQGIHVLPYMNQRLWGTKTRSWTAEGAEPFAVKGADGRVRAEVYNTFMDAPCAPMCLGTAFWRAKYAGMAQEVIDRLEADGIYMDQACTSTRCFDPRHGHILGAGRYWTDGFSLLTLEIRDRCDRRGPIALAGEGCGEPWLPSLDLMLTLDVSRERYAGVGPATVIPFFPALYHANTICYGSYGSLVYPPYDDRWPPEKKPPQCLSLLDATFCDEFCLEQARSFAWGLQPMIPNFLPSLLKDRRPEIDYLTQLVHTRMRAVKYLLHGTWLRPPALNVPEREIDTLKIGIYTPLRPARKPYPVALAGAWRAADGDVAVSLASISPEKLALRLPINARLYALTQPCAVYRIDARGRQRVGRFDPARPVVTLDLAPRGCCVLEFCRNEKP